jgi:hypothetical protein
MSNPADLNVVPQPDTDKNYFNFKATNLKINETYAIKFQWSYSDGTLSDWSPGYFITTSNETSPGVPTGTIVPSTFAGSIPVELPSFPAGARKVDVIVANGIFGTGKIAYTFFAAGKSTIAASAGTYVVELRSTNISGGTSTVGTTHTILVTDPAANFQVETPTLASGLTVNSAPFAVSVNWAGTYSSADFDGFKSIDIHVRGSDVGSTATSGFSTTTQVATLTVTGTTNRQNIGLDNLRQALSLATNTLAYTSPMFFYYITRNSEDTLYSVSGTPTYTRINSSTVNPTQANLVDLVNGVISIENLVAGNGNFSSYLRVGSSSTSGGGRIELSGVNNFTDSLTTRTVKRGITAYDSGNNEVLSFDYGAATPTLAIKGTLTGSTGVFGPVTIGTSGISSTNFSIASDGSATFNGTITANTGSIGGWSISENAFKSTAVAFPTIELDPISPKFEIRQSAHPTSESGIKVIKIDPTSGIRAGTTSNFKFTVDMDGNMSATDAVFNSGSFSGSITSSATITGGTISGATIQTSNTSYIRMDAASPSEIQLHANGFTYDGTIDFGGGTSLNVPFGSLVIQAPSNAPNFKPSISLNDINGVSIESYNSIYFSVNRPVSGTTDTSEGNVFAYMEQYGSQGAYQGRFNFEANIPVGDKSLRPIFAGTSSLPEALYPTEEIGSIYLEY